MQWQVAVESKPCRFLVYGHLVLGERELDHASRIDVDAARKQLAFRPDPDWLWGQRYPQAVYYLVTSTPDAVAAVGGDELLYSDGQPRTGGHAALATHSTAARRRTGGPGPNSSPSRIVTSTACRLIPSRGLPSPT